MAVLLREVFLASNFAEFIELRAELARRIEKTGTLRAVDLNDNAADHQPPLRRSLDRVRSSDLVVLLVGEAYGQDKPDGKRSYTHLECREARAEGIPILPYFVGRGYANKERRPRRGDPKLHPLQRELLGRDALTISFHDADGDPRELADAIVARVGQVLLGAGDGATDDDDEMALLEDGSLGTDLYSLEKGKRTKKPITSELEALCRPAEAATNEQLGEARRALEALDRKAAIHHFKKALELRPLDQDAGFELASLLLGSTRGRDLRQASTLAQRTARVAELEGNEVRQGFALALAAKAEALLDGNEERALSLISKALEAADRIAALHIDAASIYAKLGYVDRAIAEARRAFTLHPSSFWKLLRDPVLKRNRKFRELEVDLLREARSTVTAILELERETAVLAGQLDEPHPTPYADQALAGLSSLSLGKTVACGRKAAERTLQVLALVARRLQRAKTEIQVLHECARQAEAERAVILGEPVVPLSPPALDAVCLWGPALAGVVLAILTVLSWTMSVVLFGPLLGVGWLLRRALRERVHGAARRSALASQQSKLERARADVERAEATFASAVASFEHRTLELERRAVAPTGGMYSPSVGPARAAPGKLVRLKPSSTPETFVFDYDLLPPSLAPGAAVVTSSPDDHQLFRVLRRDAGRFYVARWASYFEPT